MLTAWLNEYYPKADFRADVFQTWNPHKKPKNVLKECHFLRVVHTKDTPQVLKEINRVQGQNNIFFAGAYSVEGMGLLEQAAQSGRKVAKMILAKSDVKIKTARTSSNADAARVSKNNTGDGNRSNESQEWVMIS